MRWKAKTPIEAVAKYDVWLPWFAWYPVKVKNEWVWLEWIERKQTKSKYDVGSWAIETDSVYSEYR